MCWYRSFTNSRKISCFGVVDSDRCKCHVVTTGKTQTAIQNSKLTFHIVAAVQNKLRPCTPYAKERITTLCRFTAAKKGSASQISTYKREHLSS